MQVVVFIIINIYNIYACVYIQMWTSSFDLSDTKNTLVHSRTQNPLQVHTHTPATGLVFITALLLNNLVANMQSITMHEICGTVKWRVMTQVSGGRVL